jgi:uncharacterized membrane protein YgcG
MSRQRTLVMWTAVAIVASGIASSPTIARSQRQARNQGDATWGMTQVLGRPTDRSITLSVLGPSSIEAYVEYGTRPGEYRAKTDAATATPGVPLDFGIGGLQPDTRYYYRLRERQPGAGAFREGPEWSFHTQRAAGRTFTFALQGDSHPERLNRMYDPALYARTLANVQKDQPDFYVTMGDDFSVDPLIGRGQLTQRNVDQLYIDQRQFLGEVGRSAPLFLVNGNHEQASRYLLEGTADSPPLLSGRARTRFFPLPAPDTFYSGDAEQVDGIGFLRDYYAWTWGDALFVVIDPYWHSPVQVDAAIGGGGGGGGGRGAGVRGGGGNRGGGGRGGAARGRQADATQGRAGGGRVRDWWGMSIGDAQYQWFKKTLETSKARYKFVFAHHVLGTGRGAVEMADLYEWGRKTPGGVSEFAKYRPGWDLPIHQLMVKTGVTIFFQGHDHLFARQEKDGVVYQEVPNPADATYQAFNRDAYRSGDILPDSGHLRVTVGAEQVKVEYVRAYLAKDEKPDARNGAVAFSYSLTPRATR